MWLRMLGFLFILMVAGKRVESKIGQKAKGESAKAVADSKASVSSKEKVFPKSVIRSIKWWLHPRKPKESDESRVIEQLRRAADSPDPEDTCSAQQQACLQEACVASGDTSDVQDATLDTILSKMGKALDVMWANVDTLEVLMEGFALDDCFEHDNCRKLSQFNLAEIFKFKNFKLKGLHLPAQDDFLNQYRKLPNAISPITEGEFEDFFKQGACNVQPNTMQCHSLACV